MSEKAITTPILVILKENLPILITIFTLIASVFFYAFRVDSIETALAAHQSESVELDKNQTLILQKLAVIESKQDRNTQDVQQILQELKAR